LRTKGQLEETIIDNKFPLYSIYRPGLLFVDRGERRRTMEQIAQNVLLKLQGLMDTIGLQNHKGAHVNAVAKAMINNVELKAQQNNQTPNTKPTVEVFSNKEIVESTLQSDQTEVEKLMKNPRTKPRLSWF
jgi:hypothetical protein